MNQTTTTNRIYIWDPFVRFFHWTLVLAFIIAYFTGDEESTVHAYAGYYILGLIVARIIWGFVGTRYARFSNFIYSPQTVIDYLKGFVSAGSRKRYLGHNPAAGWMIIAMLISIVITGISGLQVYGLEGNGPLAQTTTGARPQNHLLATQISEYKRQDDYDDDDEEEYEVEDETEDSAEEFWEEIHEFFANFTVLLIFLHVSGALVSSLKQRENLIKSMFTGYKQQSQVLKRT